MNNRQNKLFIFNNILFKLYYNFKSYIPKKILITFRRFIAHQKSEKYKHIWPIDPHAVNKPIWFKGWPENKQFALIIRHDVESIVGYNTLHKIIKIEESFGFRSVFNFLLRVYKLDDEKIDFIKSRGFEVGIHGVIHDAKMYFSRNIFLEYSKIINENIQKLQSSGFASPSSFHNLEWLHLLNIEYDSSTFDTDPIEPQNDAVGTIFPFCVTNESKHQYVEIPYTLPQDFTLFILLKQRNIDIWKRKIDWIAEKGGMVFVNVHPDYIRFEKTDKRLTSYSVDFYYELLDYLKANYRDRYWHVLPKEMARFCREEYKKT